MYPVNPNLDILDGEPCFRSLKDIPEIPDVVDMVVPPKVSAKVVEDCVAKGITRIWFQPGSESEEAIQKAEAAGISVVYNTCIMVKKQHWNNL